MIRKIAELFSQSGFSFLEMPKNPLDLTSPTRDGLVYIGEYKTFFAVDYAPNIVINIHLSHGSDIVSFGMAMGEEGCDLRRILGSEHVGLELKHTLAEMISFRLKYVSGMEWRECPTKKEGWPFVFESRLGKHYFEVDLQRESFNVEIFHVTDEGMGRRIPSEEMRFDISNNESVCADAVGWMPIPKAIEELTR